MKKQNRLSVIVKEIRDFCSTNADEKTAARYAKFFKEGYDAYGIDKDLWEQQKTYWIETYREELGLQGFLDVGDLLMSGGKYEEASFAIVCLVPFQKQFTRDTFQRVGAWLESGIRNWAHTDILCGNVISLFIQQGIVTLDDFSSWRDSVSKWKRRAVPVSMLTLLQETNNYEPLLEFLRPLMMDTERVVHQGLGWFLREAWKKNPKPVEAFLLEWKDAAPRLIFQYATEKMTPEQKARFRREGKKKGSG